MQDFVSLKACKGRFGCSVQAMRAAAVMAKIPLIYRTNQPNGYAVPLERFAEFEAAVREYTAGVRAQQEAAKLRNRRYRIVPVPAA